MRRRRPACLRPIAAGRSKSNAWRPAGDRHKSIETNARYALSHFYLAASLANLGRLDEALEETNAGRAIDPKFSLARLRSVGAKRQSGLSETAPARHRRRDHLSIEGLPTPLTIVSITCRFARFPRASLAAALSA
jgi:hypothetical protein